MSGFAIKRFWCTTNVLEGAGAAMIGARGARLENRRRLVMQELQNRSMWKV